MLATRPGAGRLEEALRGLEDAFTLDPEFALAHRRTAMRKVGVRTAAEFVRFAIKHKMIEA